MLKTHPKRPLTRPRPKTGKSTVSRPKTAQKRKIKPKTSKKTVPLEEVEAKIFHQWLEQNKIPHTHIANESNSGKRDAAIRARKMKEMGVARGVWDYEVYVPVYDCDKEFVEYQLLKIEMKRQRGGGSTVSMEQKGWGIVYNLAGIPHKICYGAQEAIDFVKEYYKETEESPF
jgi:hypothetical protein